MSCTHDCTFVHRLVAQPIASTCPRPLPSPISFPRGRNPVVSPRWGTIGFSPATLSAILQVRNSLFCNSGRAHDLWPGRPPVSTTWPLSPPGFLLTLQNTRPHRLSSCFSGSPPLHAGLKCLKLTEIWAAHTPVPRAPTPSNPPNSSSLQLSCFGGSYLHSQVLSPS